jgi:hypothetical protein
MRFALRYAGENERVATWIRAHPPPSVGSSRKGQGGRLVNSRLSAFA